MKEEVSNLRQSRRLEKSGTAQSRTVLRAPIRTASPRPQRFGHSLPARNEWGESRREGFPGFPLERASSPQPSPPACVRRRGSSPPSHPHPYSNSSIPGTVKPWESLQQSWRIYLGLRSQNKHPNGAVKSARLQFARPCRLQCNGFHRRQCAMVDESADKMEDWRKTEIMKTCRVRNYEG